MAEASTSAERKPGTQVDAGSLETTRQEGPLPDRTRADDDRRRGGDEGGGEAAREVRGVHELGGGVTRAIGSVTQRVGVGDERTQGVSVEVGEREAAVDLTLVIDYGESIPRVSQAVRDNVIKRLEGITGLAVTEVNLTVNDLYFPGDEVPEQPRVQ